MLTNLRTQGETGATVIGHNCFQLAAFETFNGAGAKRAERTRKMRGGK